ncbi:MAG TPA: c-type cytochrome [Methylomirabilota bacterium]|nr:c-type cytochrome [Methylomirabilota bacterium]
MKTSPRWAAAATLAALVLIALAPGPARAQQPPQPFAPDWGRLAGWTVFAEKGCGKCHGVRGVGGGGSGAAPDLGRVGPRASFFDVGAALWNHVPRMGARMREAGVERSRLSAVEASNLIAFLFTAQYADESGDARRGETLFGAKGCGGCHAVGGRGGTVGPPLDAFKRANSPVLVVAAMWNHGPKMGEAMARTGTPRPTLDGKEMLDLIAYVVSAATPAGGDTQQVVPGTPARGRALFADKKCATCHAVGGKGPRIGPDLGSAGHHVSLTEFAARMWNHAPAMTAKMKERKLEVPTLTGQDMADVLAYLYTSRYFEPAPSARRGAAVLQAKGCLGCHAVAGKGAKVGGDFARSGAVATPGGLVAAMWNHSALMEAQAAKRQVAWPELTGAELGDVAAYLASLAR